MLKRFGDLQPGDILNTPEGPAPISKTYDPHIPQEMWEIELDSGEVIKASGNHLWYCETRLDWELLPERKRLGKKILKPLLKDGVLKLLLEMAEKEAVVETNLSDMTILLQGGSNPQVIPLAVRIAEALGPIAEETETLQDMGDGFEESQIIRKYDGRLFAQQLLALSGQRAFKKYSLIVGSVVTTTELAAMDSVDLPKLESR